jgi:hypothetical protein
MPRLGWPWTGTAKDGSKRSRQRRSDRLTAITDGTEGSVVLPCSSFQDAVWRIGVILDVDELGLEVRSLKYLND